MKNVQSKNTAAVNAAESTETQEATQHPLLKSYMLVSTRHLDLHDLNAFESISMAAVLVLSVAVGVMGTLV